MCQRMPLPTNFQNYLLFKNQKQTMKKLFTLLVMLTTFVSQSQTLVSITQDNSIAYISEHKDTIIYPNNEVGRVLSEIWTQDYAYDTPVILFDTENAIEKRKIKAITAKLLTSYCKGWEIGYVEGWCYPSAYCNAPYPPVCPIPKVNLTTYQDGYNRGFIKGQNDKEKH